MVANEDIRSRAKESRIKLWEVAEYLHVADSTFSRQLRRELPNDKKQHIMDAIEDIAERKAEQGGVIYADANY